MINKNLEKKLQNHNVAALVTGAREHLEGLRNGHDTQLAENIASLLRAYEGIFEKTPGYKGMILKNIRKSDKRMYTTIINNLSRCNENFGYQPK